MHRLKEGWIGGGEKGKKKNVYEEESKTHGSQHKSTNLYFLRLERNILHTIFNILNFIL